MKKVFSNSAMVAHVWAQRTQTEGRTSTGNMYFNSDAIFSYGSHFPLAKFLDDNTVLINTDDYSVTTSKHKQEVRQALRGGVNRLYTNTAIIEHLVYAHSWLSRGEKNGRKELIDLITRDTSRLIVQQAQTAAKRRKPELKERDINQALSFYDDQVALLAFYGLKIHGSVTHLIEQLKTDLSLVTIANEKQLKAAAKKREKEQAAEAKRRGALAQQALAKWRAGEDLNYGERDNLYSYLPAIALRIRGERIETTRGAEFPIEHGKRAFPLIKRIKEQGEAVDFHFLQGHENKPKWIMLGHFNIDKVQADGTVHAACHVVPYSEIEAIAKQLNLA